MFSPYYPRLFRLGLLWRQARSGRTQEMQECRSAGLSIKDRPVVVRSERCSLDKVYYRSVDPGILHLHSLPYVQ